MGKQLEFNKWKQVPNFEGVYSLRNDGLLYSHPRTTTKGGFTYGYSNDLGYLYFLLSKNGIITKIKVHRLVWEVFVGEIPEGYDIHHKNHNPKDNRVENLELVERSKHHKIHYEENKEKLKKACIESVSKPVCQYTLNGQFVAEHPSIAEASRLFGINSNNIIDCCKGKRNTAGNYLWKYKEVA